MGLFGKDQVVASPAPSVTSIACPECLGRDFSVICLLYSCDIVDGVAKVTQNGFRLCCQHCSAIYSVGMFGGFHHHEQALPWTPKPRVMDELMPTAEPTKNSAPPRQPNAANDPLPFRMPKNR
jgi:hypothetical protein